MTILLFGSSNVGKSTTGELLAKKLGYAFYDLDEEVKKHTHKTMEEFVHTGTLYERDQIRCHIILTLLQKKEDKVMAISPMSYIDAIKPIFSDPDILSILLNDSVMNIFNRLVFSDENDRVYHDDEYQNERKDYYLEEIYEDIKWYNSVYADVKHKFDMLGMPPEEVVEALISKFHLKKR